MSTRADARKIIPVFVGSVALSAACFQRAKPAISPTPPSVPVAIVETPPAVVPTPGSSGAAVADVVADEPVIESMVVVDGDVRLILERIAEIGKLDLIIPNNIHKTISVRYVNVPVSVALKDVLSRSGLRLGSGSAGRLPFDSVTVFYRLPANVDSLSVEGIMKRFGVGRAIAELIVQSRPPIQ